MTMGRNDTAASDPQRAASTRARNPQLPFDEDTTGVVEQPVRTDGPRTQRATAGSPGHHDADAWMDDPKQVGDVFKREAEAGAA